MNKKKVVFKPENKELKEYPIIYSYIYERESEDIKRLLTENKKTKVKKKKIEEVRTIIGFRIENGKAIPIYESGLTNE